MRNDRDNDGLLEASRAIRPYLRNLVGPSADELDRRIAGLLGDAARGEHVTSELRSLLEDDNRTSAFLHDVLRDAPHYRPRYVQPGYVGARRRKPLPGNVAPVLHAGKFVCPNGDYVWYRPSVGTPVPGCPSHGVQLTPI